MPNIYLTICPRRCCNPALLIYHTQVSSIFTGEEELFAWDRTVSRLTEMQTAQYWMERDKEEAEDYI